MDVTLDTPAMMGSAALNVPRERVVTVGTVYSMALYSSSSHLPIAPIWPGGDGQKEPAHCTTPPPASL